MSETNRATAYRARRPWLGIWMAMALCWLGFAARAGGDVVVFDNCSQQTVEFAGHSGIDDHEPTRYVIARSQLLPVPVRGRMDVAFVRGKQQVQYRLDANAAYFFAGSGETLDLHKIGLGGTAETLAGRPIGGQADLESIGTLTVKILTDDDQQYTRRVWEPILRRRLEAASQALEKCCRMQLKVVVVDTWDSDDQLQDFRQSLLEFVQEVDASPADVAVGFTSQYKVTRGKTRLGGTHGPFGSHILIREWAQRIAEPERLEVLIHELGHHLGAVHSPEPSSVMRPILGDRKARRASFPIRFDPVNCLAMYLVAEEIRLRNVHRFSELSPATKARLRQIYAELSRAMPADNAARHYLQLLGDGGP